MIIEASEYQQSQRDCNGRGGGGIQRLSGAENTPPDT